MHPVASHVDDHVVERFEHETLDRAQVLPSSIDTTDDDRDDDQEETNDDDDDGCRRSSSSCRRPSSEEDYEPRDDSVERIGRGGGIRFIQVRDGCVAFANDRWSIGGRSTRVSCVCRAGRVCRAFLE